MKGVLYYVNFTTFFHDYFVKSTVSKITYTDTHIWTQVIGKLVRTLVQDRNLLQTQLSVSVSNLFAEFMRQGVQHGMVRMHARQPILLQLFSHDSHQGFHPGVVVRPIADDLQTMSQITECVGEIGLQFQGCAIALNGFRNVSGILVNGGQIGVGIGERRIDLNGASVAL